MKKLLQILILALPIVTSAQKYKTRTIYQYKWEDSTDKKTVCVEHYNAKGQIDMKEYLNLQSVVAADDDGDDKGTKVVYTYKDSLLTSERRYRNKEYEDTAIIEHSYNDKGQRVRTINRRHEFFTPRLTDQQASKAVRDNLDTTYSEDPSTGEMLQIIRKKDDWIWMNDTITYRYNSAKQVISQKGGEKWHTLSYNDKGLLTKDIAYSSPADMKAKNYTATSYTYNSEKQVTKKVKDHYTLGKKDFDNVVTYTYTNGKLSRINSIATSYSKSKAADAKYDNLRFDKRLSYNATGWLVKEETLDPDGSKLLTTIYKYE